MRKPTFREILEGLAVGAAGGLAATWVMTGAQGLSARLASAGDDGEAAADDGNDEEADSGGNDEPATSQAADAVSRGLLDRELDPEEKRKAGLAMHYAFGTAMGAVYGVAAELSPAVTAGRGAAFGTALWLLADEIAVPVLGFSEPPHRLPPSAHAQALGFHLVYGTALEQGRRLGRRLVH